MRGLPFTQEEDNLIFEKVRIAKEENMDISTVFELLAEELDRNKSSIKSRFYYVKAKLKEDKTLRNKTNPYTEEKKSPTEGVFTETFTFANGLINKVEKLTYEKVKLEHEVETYKEQLEFYKNKFDRISELLKENP